MLTFSSIQGFNFIIFSFIRLKFVFIDFLILITGHILFNNILLISNIFLLPKALN